MFSYCCTPSRLSAAKVIFGDLNIQVVIGHRFLGGFIGDSGDRHKFVLQKVLEWSDQIKTLAAVASQPHAAFAAISKSWQFEWLFSLRVIPHCGTLFADLESSLSSCFLRTLFGLD